MMKKITILLLLLFPFQVNAAMSGNIEINCDKTKVTPGKDVTCNISINVQGDSIIGFDGKLVTSSNLKVVEVTRLSDWQGDANSTHMQYYKDAQEGKVDIAKVTLQASNTTTGSDEYLKVSEIICYGLNDLNEVRVADAQANIRLTATGNNLSSLSVSGGTLTPTFQSDIINYSTSVNANKTTIQATTNNTNASISGDTGEVNLNYGLNTFKINVRSESGTTKTYTLLITRPDTRSTNNNLNTLVINGKKIEIKEEVLDYLYQVGEEVEEIKIETILKDQKASFVDGYGPRTVSLAKGKNIIEIRTKAENGGEKSYVLVVTRGTNIPEDNNPNTQGTNTTQNNKNQSKKDKLDNPKTGSTSLYIVIIIIVLASILGIVGFRWYQKKQKMEGKKENEK